MIMNEDALDELSLNVEKGYVGNFDKLLDSQRELLLELLKELLPKSGLEIPWILYEAMNFLLDLGLAHVPFMHASMNLMITHFFGRRMRILKIVGSLDTSL